MHHVENAKLPQGARAFARPPGGWAQKTKKLFKIISNGCLADPALLLATNHQYWLIFSLYSAPRQADVRAYTGARWTCCSAIWHFIEQ
jgi:hypothetical protein